jgi:lipopolysaccharide heptosyltransferase II
VSAAWRDARRILCVRLDNLGDVLMTTPALRALAETVPGRHVTLLASPAGAEAARHVGEIDDTIVYEAPWMKPERAASVADDRAMIETLASRRFDAAVIFTVYSQNPLPSAFLCHLAGIPLRLAHCRENPYHLLTTWIPETEPEGRLRHEVRRQLDLVEAVGARTRDSRLAFRVTPEERQSMLAKLRQGGVNPETPWIVLHPGASASSRRYPAERFAAAASELSRSTGTPIVVTGSGDEAPLVERICAAAGPRTRGFAGAFTLGELAAAIEGACVLISNNTGPVHISAAVGTPVVDLYALTNPQHTPWQVPSRVLYKDVSCRFCYKSTCPRGHHLCLKGVEVEQVVGAAQSLMRATAAQARAAA